MQQTKYVSAKELINQLEGRLSRNSVYQAIASGTIPSIRIGRRILIPSDALDRILEGRAGGGPPDGFSGSSTEIKPKDECGHHAEPDGR